MVLLGVRVWVFVGFDLLGLVCCVVWCWIEVAIDLFCLGFFLFSIYLVVITIVWWFDLFCWLVGFGWVVV